MQKHFSLRTNNFLLWCLWTLKTLYLEEYAIKPLLQDCFFSACCTVLSKILNPI